MDSWIKDKHCGVIRYATVQLAAERLYWRPACVASTTETGAAAHQKPVGPAWENSRLSALESVQRFSRALCGSDPEEGGVPTIPPGEPAT